MKSLRGLGYIGEGFELGEREGETISGFWDAEPKLVMYELSGELVYWILQEEVEMALQVLALAWQRRPDVARRLRNRTATEFRSRQQLLPPNTLPEHALEEFLKEAARLNKAGA